MKGMNRLRTAAVAALAAFALASQAALAAEENEVQAKSSIKGVTVYTDRAHIERSALAELKAGRTSLVFDSLPVGIDPSSLQVDGSGPVVLEDIVFRTKYFAEIPDEKIKALTEERDAAQARLVATTDRIARAGAEKAFLEKIVGKVTAVEEEGQSELNPDKWVQMMKFYRERRAFLDEEGRIAERDQRAQKADLDRIVKELSDLSSGRQKRNNQAVVILLADRPAKAEIVLSYVVVGPSWTPIYDLRVDSEKRKLELSYNAYIAQNTGEDWSGVRLSLSTARPEIGGSQPELEPWYVNIYKPSPQRSEVRRAKEAKKLEDAGMGGRGFNMAADVDMVAEEAAPAPIAVMGATARQGAVAVVFDVKGATTIQSDAAKHRVSITQASFSASFRYSTAPKLAPRAYLKAKVKNETDFPFLPGASKVFLDGAFVADSSIDLVASGEEFWTYLGVDEGVKVDYKLVKRVKDEQGLLQKKNRYVYQYETVVTNAKKADAEVVLWDQLPVSSDKDLVVKLIEPKYQKDSDALKKSNTDIFEWNFTLKPGESKKIPFSFSVEYPADANVEGL